MADDVILNLGSGGATVRTIEIASKQYQVTVPPPQTVSVRVQLTTAQANQVLISQGAGGKLGITQVQVNSSAASTNNPAIIIGLGASSVPSASGVVYSHPGLSIGLSGSRGNGWGFLHVGADGESLRMSMSADAVVDVTISYIPLPV